jgi:uncharacterized protein (TIGR02246 family)
MQCWSMRTIALALLIVVWALPCAAKDKGAQALDAAWVKAMKAGDIPAVMNCYAPDAVAWLPGAPSARGEQAIRSVYEGWLSANTVKDVTLSDTVYRTAGKMAIGWGRFSMTLVPKAGGNPVTMTGRFTEVVERRDGKWVYIVDHASAEPTGMSGAKQ